jgi:hypothetical protein
MNPVQQSRSTSNFLFLTSSSYAKPFWNPREYPQKVSNYGKKGPYLKIKGFPRRAPSIRNPFIPFPLILNLLRKMEVMWTGKEVQMFS